MNILIALNSTKIHDFTLENSRFTKFWKNSRTITTLVMTRPGNWFHRVGSKFLENFLIFWTGSGLSGPSGLIKFV